MTKHTPTPVCMNCDRGIHTGCISVCACTCQEPSPKHTPTAIANEARAYLNRLGMINEADYAYRAVNSHEAMLACLKNLLEMDLIKDKNGDHYDEVIEIISKAEGK